MRIVTWLVLGAFPAIALGQGTSADGRRTDLAAFRRDFFTMDSSYSAANRATAVSRLEQEGKLAVAPGWRSAPQAVADQPYVPDGFSIDGDQTGA